MFSHPHPEYITAHQDMMKEQDKVDKFFDNYYALNPSAPDLKMYNPWRKWTGTSDMFFTKSWLKLYEILNLPHSESYLTQFQKISSFHNCELPGGFVLSLVWWCHQHNIKVDWMMSSYYDPDSPGEFLSDKYKLINKYPHRMVMGPIQTKKGIIWSNGDMTSLKSVKMVQAVRASRQELVNIYTSDGGIEAKRGVKYNMEQDTTTLKYGEFYTGLVSLKPGGMMVVKVYDLDHQIMFGLVASVASRFDHFELHKPQISLPTNTEAFFVGWGYRPDSELINKLATSWTSFNGWVDYKHKIPPQVAMQLDSQYVQIIKNRTIALPQYLNGTLPPGNYDIPTVDTDLNIKLLDQ